MTNWQQIAEELRGAATHVERIRKRLPNADLAQDLAPELKQVQYTLLGAAGLARAAEQAEMFVANKEPTA